ncbi:UTP-glucose-1-phosphate uridylyltransferase [Salix suchowensis]|nr:UTP-glucose-1-phosphate uridylyltransferase [Salix suchowensis]
MRNEISRLVSTVDDPQTKRDAVLLLPLHPLLGRASQERPSVRIYPRSLLAKDLTLPLSSDWDRIKSPADDQIVPYSDLPAGDAKNLNKLAVLKVNGGLGTSMGMSISFQGSRSPKSAQTNRASQHHLSRDVPLILMTSFNTHEDTLRIIKKYANQQLRITTFNQSRYPRIFKETLLPCPKRADDDKKAWYPPGHGDVYNALLHSGVLDQLLSEGKEYLFISNSDNLGAVVDESILQHMIDSGSEFIMEVTDKTKADVKARSIRLLEIAQVPSNTSRTSIRKFKIFNTNNLWVNLKALKRIMETEAMDLEIIINPKTTDDGQAVIQV